MQLFTNTNIDFMTNRKVFYLIAGILIIVSLGYIIFNGGLKYGIDFEGGLALEIAPIEVNGVYLTVFQIREALSKHGFSEAVIQELPRTESFLIRTKSDGQSGNMVIEALREEFPEHTNTETLVRSLDDVGPRAGADLRQKAVNAVLLALLLILIYIWIRFRFAWGFFAAFALLIDTIVTLGVLSIMKIEIGMTVLAGMLTIVGYSINNTIVIFDRIRENLKLYRKESDFSIVNRSINETLSRTILLTFTTLIACLSLLIFGGPVIFDFAFTFTVGILIGSFSSMLIATGLVLDIVITMKNKKTDQKKK